MAIYVTGDTHGADKFGFHSVDGFVNRLNIHDALCTRKSRELRPPDWS